MTPDEEIEVIKRKYHEGYRLDTILNKFYRHKKENSKKKKYDYLRNKKVEETKEEIIFTFKHTIAPRLQVALNTNVNSIAKLIHFLIANEKKIHDSVDLSDDNYWLLKDIFKTLLAREPEDQNRKIGEGIGWLMSELIPGTGVHREPKGIFDE